MSGNDIGEENTQDLIILLNSLVDKFSNLTELDISDCKIDLENSSDLQLDGLVKKLLDKILTGNIGIRKPSLSKNFRG